MIQGSEQYPKEVYRYIGARLKQVRNERGLTQAQVAAIIRVSPQQYQKYEDASTKCSLVHIYTLAEHYAVPADEFLPVNTNADPAPLPGPVPPQNDLATDADLVARLVSGFMAITERRLRQSIVDIVEATRKSVGRDEERRE